MPPNTLWHLSEFSQGQSCALQPPDLQAVCQTTAEGVIEPERWDQFARYSGAAYREAVRAANDASSDGALAVASDGRFTKQNAGLTPDTLVWSSLTGDPAEAIRQFACPELSSTPQQCLTAELLHPDIAGDHQYAETFALLPQVRSWFGTTPPDAPTAAFTVSASSGTPPFAVAFDGSDSRVASGIASYHWYFGDGSDLITTAPVVAHVYGDPGPSQPVFGVTFGAGRQALAQADAPIVARDVPRIPAAFSAVQGSATVGDAAVTMDLAQRVPAGGFMTGPITISSPRTGSLTVQSAAPVERGPDPKTQIHSSASVFVEGRPFSLEWSYTAVAGGGYLVVDLTGGVQAHIEGDVAADTIAPIVRNYYQTQQDLP